MFKFSREKWVQKFCAYFGRYKGEERNGKDRGGDEVREEGGGEYLKRVLDMRGVRVAGPWKCASHAAELVYVKEEQESQEW